MPETPQKMAPTTESPKSSPSKKEIDAATMALNHFAQGKRHLVVSDIPNAVNSFQEACKSLAEQYGETAPECGDAYFYYGKALLEMARLESGVIGNALDGDEEGSTENEEEDSEADAESQGGDEGEGEDENKDGEKPEGEEGGEEENEIEGDKTEEDEEEVSNLQLAWEMLELAKMIFEKQQENNTKMKIKVSEVHLKLGEVGLEGENYPQGIDDFKKCLEIQQGELKKDDRCLAETHYQLGIAYSFCDDFDKAIESFTDAVKVLETRIDNLNKIKKEKANWTEKQKMDDAAVREDPFYTEQGEIDELNQLLPEMKEKIVDMEQMKKDSAEKIRAAKEAIMSGKLGESSGASSSAFGAPSSSSPFGAPSSSSPFGAPSSSSPFGAPSSSSKKDAKPIMAVRKKRKLEGEDKDEAKKTKGESGQPLATVNGSNVANGISEKKDTNAAESQKDKNGTPVGS